MGSLLGKIIPIEMLARMPLPFVHRLRDIRIKQIEEANRQQEIHMRQQQINQNNASRAAYSNSQPTNGYTMYPGATYEDLIDELT